MNIGKVLRKPSPTPRQVAGARFAYSKQAVKAFTSLRNSLASLQTTYGPESEQWQMYGTMVDQIRSQFDQFVTATNFTPKRIPLCPGCRKAATGYSYRKPQDYRCFCAICDTPTKYMYKTPHGIDHFMASLKATHPEMFL